MDHVLFLHELAVSGNRVGWRILTKRCPYQNDLCDMNLAAGRELYATGITPNINVEIDQAGAKVFVSVMCCPVAYHALGARPLISQDILRRARCFCFPTTMNRQVLPAPAAERKTRQCAQGKNHNATRHCREQDLGRSKARVGRC